MRSRIGQLAQTLAHKIDRLASEHSIQTPEGSNKAITAEASTTFPYPRDTETEPQLFETVEAGDSNLAVSNDGKWLVHYSRLYSEEELNIFNLYDHAITQKIVNSKQDEAVSSSDSPSNAIKSVAFSDDNTHLLAAASYYFNIFKLQGNSWILKQNIRTPNNHECDQAIFVQDSNDSIIMMLLRDDGQIYPLKINITPTKETTTETYCLENVILQFPGHSHSVKRVIDRSGRPNTNARYELLSVEKTNTVFSMDCSLIATIHNGAIHLLRRGETQRDTKINLYSPQIRLDIHLTAPFNGMCFNPNADVFFVCIDNEVCVFDILESSSKPECRSKYRFSNVSDGEVYACTNTHLVFLRKSQDQGEIFTLRCMTEQRDSLRRRIGYIVAGVPIINGDILLEIAHRLIYGYGYDDTLWPSIEAWIRHEFSKFFQNQQ